MTAGKGRLHAEISGDVAAGAPVVFLHGFGGSANVWGRVRRDLGAAHATLAYDLPGHARSIEADGAGGAGRMAKAIAADLAHRGIDRFHLVGHSMGGAVAALIAMREADKTASLTLLAPGGFGPEINHRLLQRYAEASDVSTMRAALENMFGWNNTVPADYVSDLVALRQAPGAVTMLQSLLPSMVTGEGAARMQGMLPRDALAELAMPVKVLWGTQDRVLPTRQAHKLPPRFAAHVFEDTGHMLIEEQPEAVVALIAQNLKTGA